MPALDEKRNITLRLSRQTIQKARVLAAKRSTSISGLLTSQIEQLAETEDELIVGIPLVRGLRPIVVQPQAVFVPFQVENVRVAVLIGSVRRAIRATARLIKRLGCILFGIENPRAPRTKLFLFCWRPARPPRKAALT